MSSDDRYKNMVYEGTQKQNDVTSNNGVSILQDVARTASTLSAGSKGGSSKSKVENAVYELKKCVLNYSKDIIAAKNTKFTKESLNKLCDFKFYSKIHFTPYFVTWEEGDITYAGLSEQYRGNSSGRWTEEKKSFLQNGGEIYTDFSENIITKYNRLKKAVQNSSSNISSIKKNMKDYQQDINQIRIKSKNNKLKENIETVITELDSIEKLLNCK